MYTFGLISMLTFVFCFFVVVFFCNFLNQILIHCLWRALIRNCGLFLSIETLCHCVFGPHTRAAAFNTRMALDCDLISLLFFWTFDFILYDSFIPHSHQFSTQLKPNIIITLFRRCCDVMTSQRRHDKLLRRLCICCVSIWQHSWRIILYFRILIFSIRIHKHTL